MKIIKKIFVILLLIITFIPNAYANEKNLVNIYLFHSDTCIHCSHVKEILNELNDKYDNIKIYKYEVSDSENALLLEKVAELYDMELTGVPFTVIGDKAFKGYSYDDTKRLFSWTIEYYSENGYQDRVGEYLGNIELPSYIIEKNGVSIDEYLDNYDSYMISLFGKKIDLKRLLFPVDGLNIYVILLGLIIVSLLIWISKYLIKKNHK